MGGVSSSHSWIIMPATWRSSMSIWNGLLESAKIAAMADVYEINVAPHNFYGHLCSAISATFSAIVPNFRVMEIDIDSAPWRDEFYTVVPTIENGEFVLPPVPGGASM